MRGLVIAGVALTLAAGPAAGQGSLSTLGFGYPVGGPSARSLATGTSLSDLDPQSPLNPASIVLNARAQVYAQLEPEFRTVTVGGNAVRTSATRFPLFMVSGRQGPATFALSFSSFTDRTWATSYPDTQAIGSERIASTVLSNSDGGIADVRGAFSWTFNEKLHAGFGIHVYPGQNKVVSGRVFSDSVKAGNYTLTNTFDYSGTAASFGLVAMPYTHLIVSGDLRVGGSLVMRLGDSTEVGRGKIPFKAGVTASYDGIPGSLFSLRIGHDKWSDLRGLGSSTLGLKDANDIAFGTEITGPRMTGGALLLRAGVRSRGLPFAYGASDVHENSASGGFGVPIFGGRTVLDFGAVHASRTAPGVNESAWLFSLGIGVRP